MAQKKHGSRRAIMAAVDFSTTSQTALLWAAKTADETGTPLLAIHVVHDPGATPGYYNQVKKAKKHIQRIEEAADEMMGEFLERVRSKNPELPSLKRMEPLLVVGLPVSRIIEVATGRNVRQIVMGSRGRTGLPALLLGSKALKVAQLAPMPVTIVKDGGAT